MQEVIETGRKYRVLANAETNSWYRLSFWKKASDVEFDDGTILEDKLGGFSSNMMATKEDLDALYNKYSTWLS